MINVHTEDDVRSYSRAEYFANKMCLQWQAGWPDKIKWISSGAKLTPKQREKITELLATTMGFPIVCKRVQDGKCRYWRWDPAF